jgi:uncharacterized protein
LNWAFFILRFVIAAGLLSLFFFSQRYWHKLIWRTTADFQHQWMRVAARILWLAMVLLVISAFVDGVRMGHRHLIPRGTIASALVGLWFFSALFAFLAVKLVRGFDLLWSRFRERVQRTSVAEVASCPNAAVTSDTPSPVEQLPDPSRRYFFQAVTAAAGAAPFLGAMYGYAAERLNYQVRRVEIPIAGLDPALDGLSIAQLSDIHMSGYMPRAQVRRAVDMTNELGAQIAVVTGDFITSASDPLADCIEELGQLRAPLGVWGCNGNHEIYAGAENAAQTLFAQAGMKLLRQENTQLACKGASFNLIGVDYQRERTSQGHKRQTLANVDSLVRRDMLNVLLSHNPNSFPRAAELGIELSLAGHTHGGQIQVEILDHRLSPARFITDHIAGLYQRTQFAPALPETSRQNYGKDPRAHEPSNNSTAMASIYVNRGIGTVGAPVRLGVPPEISLLVLRRV